MTLGRALLLGAFAGVVFAEMLEIASLFTITNAVFAGLAFVLLAPVLDRVALRLGGDAGPRVFWNAACWLAPALFWEIASAWTWDPEHGIFGALGAGSLPIVIAVPAFAALILTGMRRAGVRSTVLRRMAPWVAIAVVSWCTVSVLARVLRSDGDGALELGKWLPPARVPMAALLGLGLAVLGLFRRSAALARLRGLDLAWRAGTMSADGRVTVEGLPPMTAPTGIVPLAGPVLVQLAEAPMATFREPGAPRVTKLLQGVDADFAGRRAILDEGAWAYATAAALLPAAALFDAFFTR